MLVGNGGFRINSEMMWNIERLVLHAEDYLRLFKLLFTISKRVTEGESELPRTQIPY